MRQSGPLIGVPVFTFVEEPVIAVAAASADPSLKRQYSRVLETAGNKEEQRGEQGVHKVQFSAGLL